MEKPRVSSPQLIIDDIKTLNISYKDILNLLKQLTTTPTMTKQDYLHIITHLPTNHIIFVLMENDKPVGMITLFMEQKIIHNGGKVAHIEDVVVDKNHRGKGYATLLLKHATSIAKNYKCYKCILNCTDQVKPVYEKNGFSHKTNGMSLYF
tara:strand:- start:123 stop:575 length:453 start_codon:yes stop_codon:yes gene_type:complete